MYVLTDSPITILAYLLQRQRIQLVVRPITSFLGSSPPAT
jgi:hypothetical protein